MLYSAFVAACKTFQRSKDMTIQIHENEPTRAPIFKLSADLLYLVFRMNADDDEGSETGENQLAGTRDCRAMTTMRHCSQVCRPWRDIILSSPSLWGRILDFQQLDQESDHWREEVIRRSGNAFLHITGIVRGYNRISRDFLYYLIINHWSRVRVIDIDVYHPNVFKPDTWNFLIRPSPFLQSLKLRFHPRTLSSTSILPHGSIFANDAPSLREFYVEQLLFDTRISWFSHIRSFGVFPSSKLPVTTAEILDILSHMPLLESLSIGDVRKGDAPERIDIEDSSIELPRLQEVIFVDVEMNVCTTILGKLSPSPACVLDIYCTQRMRHGIGSSSPANDNLAKNIFIRYFKGFFHNHLVSALTLRQWNGVYTLESNFAKPKYPTYPHSKRHRFRVSIDHYNPFIVFEIFTACQYPTVNKLEVALDVTKPSPIQAPYMVPFLQCFTNVETVTANKPALRFFHDISEDISVLFPSLKTLEIQPTSIAMLPGAANSQKDHSF